MDLGSRKTQTKGGLAIDGENGSGDDEDLTVWNTRWGSSGRDTVRETRRGAEGQGGLAF